MAIKTTYMRLIIFWRGEIGRFFIAIEIVSYDEYNTNGLQGSSVRTIDHTGSRRPHVDRHGLNHSGIDSIELLDMLCHELTLLINPINGIYLAAGAPELHFINLANARQRAVQILHFLTVTGETLALLAHLLQHFGQFAQLFHIILLGLGHVRIGHDVGQGLLFHEAGSHIQRLDGLRRSYGSCSIYGLESRSSSHGSLTSCRLKG